MHANPKNLYIIGNGVIAKALAVALSVNGKNVTILRGSIDNCPESSEHLQVQTGGSILSSTVKISAISNYNQLDGVILLTNKSFGNATLAERLRDKAGDSPIVFLQNGLNVEHSFIGSGYQELYRCVLLATSQSINDEIISFKPVSSSPIGIIKGNSKTLQTIVDEINTDVFSFRAEQNIQPIIWKKVISNCVFNSICPLLEVDNGIFHRDPAALLVAKQVIEECLAVAHSQQIQLTFDEVLQNILTISKASDGQKISTYQDILNKRETEIDALNLAVARVAGDLPVKLTATLGQLIKIKSGF